MKNKNIGWFLVALPFLGLIVWFICKEGWWILLPLVKYFGTMIIAGGSIILGIFILLKK